jgi:hypothetical protein
VDQTMYLEDIEQVINQTLEELFLGRGSFRRMITDPDFVRIEFAALADDDSVIETIRENFQDLVDRFGWKHCRVYRDGSCRVEVTLKKDGPYLQFLTPKMPRRQPMLLED